MWDVCLMVCVILRSRGWRSHCRQLEINWRRAENYSRPMRMVCIYQFLFCLPFLSPPLPRLISHFLFVVVATVIGWLNKQINDQMLGGRVPPPGPTSLPLSTIRHSSPLTSAPHMVCKCHSFLSKDKLGSNLKYYGVMRGGGAHLGKMPLFQC